MQTSGVIEFTRQLFRCGGISPKGILLLPVYYLQLIAAIPFMWMQNLMFGRRIQNTEIRKDPVFIVGHYRSGTTYLQKLLKSNQNFGFLTNYDSVFANTNLLFGPRVQLVLQRMINFFGIKNPFFNTSAANLSDPAEEDDFLMNKASRYTAYWGFVFPGKAGEWLNENKRFSDSRFVDGWKKEYIRLLKYMAFKNPGRQLVLKNPPSTGRIKFLIELFPQAKFIFIYRNPYHVYYSTLNMWNKAIIPYYSLQQISAAKLDEIIFSHYSELMDAYEKQKTLIPKENLTEVSYENLISDPFSVIQGVYSSLKLGGFDSSKDELMKCIEIETQYRVNRYSFSGDTIEKIAGQWGQYIKKWNYDIPGQFRC